MKKILFQEEKEKPQQCVQFCPHCPRDRSYISEFSFTVWLTLDVAEGKYALIRSKLSQVASELGVLFWSAHHARPWLWSFMSCSWNLGSIQSLCLCTSASCLPPPCLTAVLAHYCLLLLASHCWAPNSEEWRPCMAFHVLPNWAPGHLPISSPAYSLHLTSSLMEILTVMKHASTHSSHLFTVAHAVPSAWSAFLPIFHQVKPC